ncbi:hypothetical protein [Amycolatopsis benzoatilytica]|uniref:hypothetical protein n=1 Tax=Amycolatopsis benzoatilytica TaxID=346045 RepID=UPI000374DE68|nr:hypothetical protein [Amycolatopsis benzoatilytica]
MKDFMIEYVAARQAELRAAARPQLRPVRTSPARQRLGWWLMELGLRLAAPPAPAPAPAPRFREGPLQGI